LNQVFLRHLATQDLSSLADLMDELKEMDNDPKRCVRCLEWNIEHAITEKYIHIYILQYYIDLYANTYIYIYMNPWDIVYINGMSHGN